ncbi:MAG TPA: hypothetical protein VM327_04970 [Candidatus Thermoplasmatota archaeon]|nr:hypothetical protein [Candidatus Thermoplasmatota archaeon]
MRFVLLLVAALMAGCSSSPPAEKAVGDTQAEAYDSADYRDGVVLVNEEFTVTATAEAHYAVDFEPGTRLVILEIQQDSGVMPNLHVEVEGCGGLDTPASAGWQAYPLCDEPAPGNQQVILSVKPGSPAGTGRFLIRADLPS